ncbi:MAG: hypothetical protein FWB86_11110 [Treponema sp.]|nr:hypothetical protein [Treponema sp.]MCL2273071.1 hypothetical protein [Treponema sp.]
MKKMRIFIFIFFLAAAAVYGQPVSYIIYDFDKTWSTNQFSLRVKLSENDAIIGYTICDERHTLNQFWIEISPGDFENFRNALDKFLEWDELAGINNMSAFRREIPLTVKSNNVLWTMSYRDIYTMDEKEMVIGFNYRWSPANAELLKSQLEIRSTTVSSINENNTFEFIRSGINIDEARLMFDSLTDEKIQETIQNKRSAELELERQRLLLEELFR